jgi:uncharacterized DUF497 family protein
MNYDFEWDPVKDRLNRKNHGVRFEQATHVFRDPRAVTVFDEEHSKTEDRWVTIGLSASGGVLVVHHTFRENSASSACIRIISSRKAVKREISQYMEK